MIRFQFYDTLIAVFELPHPFAQVSFPKAKQFNTMYTPPLPLLFLAALCLTLLPAHAEEVLTTPAVYIAANANRSITFKTPLDATLLKSVSLVNVAQQGACSTEETSLAVALFHDVHNLTVGFNHSSSWAQFIGTNTSGTITVGITALSCACNISVVAVFYYVDPTPVTVSSGVKVIGSTADVKTYVPLSEYFVSGMTLRLVNLVDCENPSFQVLMMDVALAYVSRTFTAVGDTLTLGTNTLLHVYGTSGRPSVNPTVVVAGISSTCVASFVIDLSCHHVDIPTTMPPPPPSNRSPSCLSLPSPTHRPPSDPPASSLPPLWI